MTLRFTIVFVSGLLLGLPTLGHAHGGRYRGPRDLVAPPYRTEMDWTPSNTPGGPGTPGPGAPRTGRRPGAGTASRKGGFELYRYHRMHDWEFWWAHEVHRFLPRPPTQLSKELVAKTRTTLLDILPKETNPHTLASLLMALGRIEGAPMEPFVEGLTHANRDVQATALLSLGLSGHDDSYPILENAISSQSDPWLRAYATFALGLSRRETSRQILGSILEEPSSPQSSPDVQACALIALAALEGPRQDRASVFLDVMEERPGRMPPTVRALAPIALSKLPGRATEDEITRIHDIANGKDMDTSMRQSIAIAMGRMAKGDDLPVVDTLKQWIDTCIDRQTIAFSLIALGEIGGRSRGDATDIFDFLIARTSKPDAKETWRTKIQAWSSLASAILLRGLNENQGERRACLIDVLAELLREGENASLRNAAAIASALIGASEHEPHLRHLLANDAEERLHGPVAFALGYLGIEFDDSILDPPTYDSRVPYFYEPKGYRVHAIRGLSLASSERTSSRLLELMSTSWSLCEAATAAIELSKIRDPDIAEALVQLARNRALDSDLRALAITALGLTANKNPRPWTRWLAQGFNYRLRTPVLANLLGQL